MEKFQEAIDNTYAEHKLKCESTTCSESKSHNEFSFILSKALSELDLPYSDDMFSTEEKKAADYYLNELITSLQKELEMSSEKIQILEKELTELKSLYFLGKKNLNQFFLLHKYYQILKMNLHSSLLNHFYE